jgi:3-phenylpropionate/trans-cinnamate dioxygenase ferredoxin reductase subunit
VDERQFVIVGASLAGARAAEKLREHGFAGRILMFGDEEHPPYERPPLSKSLLSGTSTHEATYLRPIEDWKSIDVELIASTTIVQARPGPGGVVAADGRTFDADAVLLTTGGRNRRLGIPGEALPGVHDVRTVDDAVALREEIVPGAAVVVIGGGFIGFEVAATAKAMGADVVLLEQASVPLVRGLGERWGAFIAELHQQRGVDVRTGVQVVVLHGDTAVREVELAGGERLSADVVIIGVGMIPATELAEQAGARVEGGVVVDAGGRTTVEGLFAAGDVTVQPGWRSEALERVESWQNAQDQAGAAAAAMLGLPLPPRTTPWFWSDQAELNIQVAGRVALDCEVVLRGDPGELKFVAFHLRDGALQGAFGLNSPREIRGVMALIDAGISVNPEALADPSVDLRKLARSAARP